MELELVPLLQSKLVDARNALPPRTIEADRLLVAFKTAFNKNPRIPECSPASVVASFMNCAALGLIPNTPEQHAYLIPRKSDGVLECNLEIGYRGFVHMILRGDRVSHVESGIVHKGDVYEFQKGDPVICRHSPNLETPNRGATPAIASYCLIVFANGGKRLEVMDSSDLAKIEAAMMRQNNGKQSPAWKEWPDEMKRKAVIKRIAKTCDLGAVVAKAIDLDNEAFRPLQISEPRKLMLPTGDVVAALPRRDVPQLTDTEQDRQLDPIGKDGNFDF